MTLDALVQGLSIPGEDISTGLTINGTSYTLLEERGHGAQGKLYSAKCDNGTLVAVKILHKRPDADERERIATWKKVNDVPHVTRLLDHGKTSLDLKNYALVSDYVDGVTLEQLRNQRAISEEVLREILSQSATILDGIHQQEVLHRDIKPSNIMINRHGEVYITDLGISRSADIGTLTGTIMAGSPLYAAPEQLQGNPEKRSDVYSLGLTIYYLMKGEHPPLFPSLDYKRDLSFYSLDYSDDFIRIVQKMCEHDVEKRYKRASEVVAEIQSLESKVDGSLVEDGVLVPLDSGEVTYISSEVVGKQDIAAKKEGIRKLEDEVQKYRRFLYWSVPSACLSIASFLGANSLTKEYPIMALLALSIGGGVGITTLISSEVTGSDLYQKSKQLRAARKELETLEIKLEKNPAIKIKKEEQRDYEQNYQDIEKVISKLRDGGTALCAALAGYYLYGGAELASTAAGVAGLLTYGTHKAVQRWQANNHTKKLRTIDDKIAALESQAITVPQSKNPSTSANSEILPLDKILDEIKKPKQSPRGKIAYALALLPFTSSYTPYIYVTEVAFFCINYGGISDAHKCRVTGEQTHSETGYDIKISVKIGEYSATFIRQRGILGDEDYRIRFEVLDVSDPKTVSLRAHLSLSPQDCIIRSFERFEEKPYTNDIPIGDLETDVKSRLFKHYREFQRQLQQQAPDLFKHLYAPIAVK